MSCAAVGSLGGCFQADATRGLPCTGDDACGSLSCEYGVCGGPVRCEAGAGVGDYCYVVTDEAFPVGTTPTALAIADVNSDFVRDIVTADGGSRGVSILLGDATGSFASHDLGLPELPGAPTALALGHLDGSGWSDIAVVTDNGGVHAVLIGDDGALGSVAPVASAVARATRPTIADFVQDGAGVRDIAVLGEDGVFVARNVDLASFESSWRATAVDNPRDMLTIQDAAGDPAFAYVARVSDDDISSLSHKGDGTFSSVQSIPVGEGPVSFAIADLNSDDYADALVVSSTGSLWLTKGKSANRDEWSPPERLYDLGWVPNTLDVLDLDDDGDPDVVVSGMTPDGHSDVFLLENDGEGRMIYGGSLGVRDASAAALADLDRDGVPEVVITAAEDGVVRLARRAKAPPMPGDDDGTEEGSTAASVGPATVADSGEEVTGTSLDEGPLDTGIDPTAGGECEYYAGVGAVELARCSPLDAVGYHDHLGFALVDLDPYEDIVTVVSDAASTNRLVAFCSQIFYGESYADTTPQLCLDIPLPAPATGLAGGTILGWSPAVAVTHDDAVSIALPDGMTGIWDLQAFLAVDGAGIHDPSFYDLGFDGLAELLFASADGIHAATSDLTPLPMLVYPGPGTHDPHGSFSIVPGKGKDLGMVRPEVLFALDDVTGNGTIGALMTIPYDPANLGDGNAVPILQDPMLAGLREFEVIVAGAEGIYVVVVVGPERNLAVVFGDPGGSPEVFVDMNFAGIAKLLVVNLDGEPIRDDLIFIGSFQGGPSTVHMLVNDVQGEQHSIELGDIVEPSDLAAWAVPCELSDLSATEILISTSSGIERVRAVNTCS